MRKQLAILVLLLTLAWSTAALANPISGELQVGAVYELDEGITSVPIHATVAVSDDLQGKGKLYLAVKGTFDPVDNVNDVALGQAYGTVYLGDVDLTVGRQVISWGTVDAFGPTNYFARLSEAALLQGTITGEPVTGVQAAYYGPSFTVTGVVLPIFAPQELSPLMRAALLKEPAGKQLLAAIENAELPEKTLANMEWGLRVETTLQGWDVQLSAYSGFEPLPGVQAVTVLAPFPTTELRAQYRRQTFVGAAAAGFLGDLGIKGEIAYGGPAAFAEVEPGAIAESLSQNEKAWKGTVGLEYVLPVANGLMVQGQYIHAGAGSLFSPYRDPTAKEEAAHYLLGRIAYNFTLEDRVELTALYSTQDGSAVLLPSFTYRLPQGMELKGTFLKNIGEGELDQVPDQVRLSVTYRF